MDRQNLTTLLLQQFESRFVSTFFINGPPGAGKTYLLNQLAESLPAYMPNTQVLGPYPSSFDRITINITEDLLGSGYLNSLPPGEYLEDWYGTWNWLKDHLKVSNRQNFLILIRLDDDNFSECEDLRSWFSSLRYMEHYWNNNKIRLLIVVAGYWNHVALEEHYRAIQLSFPYTTSTNYLVWNKISQEEAITLVSKALRNTVLTDAFGKLFHEVTGGLPGAMVDILAFLKLENPGFSDVMIAARNAAEKGEQGKALIASWLKYPAPFTELLRQLLLYRKITAGNIEALDLLNISGVISPQEIMGKPYIQISSLYIELLLRKYAGVLGLNTEEWRKVQFDEFVPGLTTFNVEAYRIINHIENLVRNFALARLYEKTDQDVNVLQNKVLRRKKDSPINEDDDIFERAVEWRQRSKQKGMDVTFNPLITYVSTGDLADLIREIAVTGDPLWDDIVKAIEKITPIRHAVMHHQLIDEKNLESLYGLQVKIYSALNR